MSIRNGRNQHCIYTNQRADNPALRVCTTTGLGAAVRKVGDVLDQAGTRAQRPASRAPRKDATVQTHRRGGLARIAEATNSAGAASAIAVEIKKPSATNAGLQRTRSPCRRRKAITKKTKPSSARRSARQITPAPGAGLLGRSVRATALEPQGLGHGRLPLPPRPPIKIVFRPSRRRIFLFSVATPGAPTSCNSSCCWVAALSSRRRNVSAAWRGGRISRAEQRAQDELERERQVECREESQYLDTAIQRERLHRRDEIHRLESLQAAARRRLSELGISSPECDTYTWALAHLLPQLRTAIATYYLLTFGLHAEAADFIRYPDKRAGLKLECH